MMQFVINGGKFMKKANILLNKSSVRWSLNKSSGKAKKRRKQLSPPSKWERYYGDVSGGFKVNVIFSNCSIVFLNFVICFYNFLIFSFFFFCYFKT